MAWNKSLLFNISSGHVFFEASDEGKIDPCSFWVTFSSLATVTILAYILCHTRRKIAFEDWISHYKTRNTTKAIENSERPPSVEGNYFFGNAWDIYENMAKFLRRVADQHGQVALVRVFNRKVAVLSDIHSFYNFCHESRFDFRPIINQVNKNVFGFSVSSAAVDEHRKRLVYFYRSIKMNETVLLFDANLSATLNNHENRGINVNVHDFVIKTGFLAILQTLVGSDNKDYDPKNSYSRERAERLEGEAAHFYSNYSKFAKFFNHLWIGLPLKLFPSADDAFAKMLQLHPTLGEIALRKDVCPYLLFACKVMRENGSSEDDILRHSIELIHVHANIVRLAYWMLIFSLSDAEASKVLSEEIDGVIAQKLALCGGKSNDEPVYFEIEEIESIQSLTAIFKETMRLVSGVVVIRAVTQDTTFSVANGQKFRLQRGETIMFYPPAHHRDGEIFEHPDKFIWNRFVDASFSKNGQFIEKPLLAFGSLCIGQRFAAILSKWYIIQLFQRWHMKLTGPIPKINEHYQGHEILPPIGDTSFNYEPRVGVSDIRVAGQLSSTSN